MKLQDKVAVITGGSKGIGYGCADVFAGHGCKVVIGARDQEVGETARKQLANEGHTVMFIPTDVTREKDVHGLIDQTIQHFGRLDCMVNNVGWHPPEMMIDQTTVRDFEDLLRLNLTSTFIGCKLAVPHLRRTQGNIINISSLVALRGQQGAVSYATTKAGQLGLTRALARDLAPEGVRVNAVCPAGVLTPLMRDWANQQPDPAGAIEKCDASHPIGRMATINEIGEVCAFLASDEAAFITGQTICPDGGAMLA